VELAGLKPATSWVRFTREASPPFADVRRLSQLPKSAACSFATVRDASSSLLDQNLTTNRFAAVPTLGLSVLRLPPRFVFELAARPARQAHSVELCLCPRDHPPTWMRYAEIDPDVDVVARAHDVRAIQAVLLRLSFNVRRDLAAIDPPAALRVLFQRWPTSREVDVDDDTIAWQMHERSPWRQLQDRVAVPNCRRPGLSLSALRE
jgi:hypothetical protein